MILDNVKNIGLYENIGEKFKTAFDFINDTDLESLEVGKYEIAGDDVFVMISEYTTQDESERLMEAHYKYADIQVIISGKETIFYAPNASQMKLNKEYSEEKDCIFYDSTVPETKCLMQEGDFAIFYPNEFHKPCCNYEVFNDVKKAVFKIKLA